MPIPSKSTPQQSQESSIAAPREALNLDNAITRFNLNLLASFCETNNSANSAIGVQSPKQANSADTLTPNHGLIGQPSSNSMANSFLKSSPTSPIAQNSSIQSSVLNSTLLDRLPDFSFGDNLLATKGAATANHQTNNFSLPKAQSDRSPNDSSIAGTSEMSALSRVSSLASPTSLDHAPSCLPASNQSSQSKSGKSTMAIRCKFGHLGSNKGQFSSPHGFCLGAEEEIVIIRIATGG